MNVYCWNRIRNCTDNHHSEAGIVVFADSLARAREIIIENGCRITNDDMPDEIRTTEGNEAFFVMPDAGCC